MKLLLIVLDGGADIGKNTPYQMAKKPNIDMLAKNGVVGMLDLEYKKTIDSDLGFLKLLGSYDEKTYPGRGIFDAMGAGIKLKKGNLYIRGNFATLDKDGNVIDRRAGREEAFLDDLTESLEGIEIDGIKFNTYRVLGHRVIIEMEGQNLSPNVTSNDKKTVNIPLPQMQPMNPKAKFTASVLNKFIYRIRKILSDHPVNNKRSVPANIILVRSMGYGNDLPESFQERFGLKGCVICGHLTATGIAKYLRMDVIDVKGANGLPNTNLEGKKQATLKALDNHDFVWLHINGTDTLSHNRKREEKTKFIEKVDKILGDLIKEYVIICLTSDHRSASAKDHKGYEHQPDPVPFLISGGNIKPDHVESFDEKTCESGFLKLKGNELMRKLLDFKGR